MFTLRMKKTRMSYLVTSLTFKFFFFQNLFRDWIGILLYMSIGESLHFGAGSKLQVQSAKLRL
jgi:hypothetical protein